MTDHLPTVLIIEDDLLIRRLFQAILEANGFRVLDAADADAGIALALRERPDLVLMDLQLPGVDGLTATSILRGQPGMAQVPIIAVTGHVTREHRRRAQEAGCTDFLGKPVPAQALVDAARKALNLPLVKWRAPEDLGRDDAGR